MSPEGVPATRRTQMIVLAGLAAIILIAAIAISQGGGDDDPSPSGGGEAEALFEGIPQEGIALGDPDGAEATVVEFVDMQCPFCGAYAREALPEVIERHVRTGELALQLRVLDFLGEDSTEAQRMAAAAQLQDRLWQFSEAFFERQGEENSGYVTPEFLDEVATEAGLDLARAEADLEGPEVEAIVEENNRAGRPISGTPTFLLLSEGGGSEELNLSDLTADAFTEALEAARGGT